MNLRTLWKFWTPPNYENFCSEFSDFFPDPPPCWENLIDYHVQIRRASLTPFSVFGFPWKLLTASVQFTPYGLISVLQTASFFFNLSEKGTFTDISLSIINICLHIQTDKKNHWCLSYKNIFMVGGRFSIKLKQGVTPKLEVMLLPQSSL